MIDSYIKTKEGRQAIRAYAVNEYPFGVLPFKAAQKNHKIISFATDYICLDTETSHTNLTTGWIYQWAARLGKHYVYGRKPSEIIQWLEDLAEYYQLSDTKKIILYIHNASYDLQYLKHFIYKYDPMADFLAIDAHAILQCNVIGFKIICSYKLTNLSLAALSKNYAKQYVKAVGEVDYDIIRYQDSELTASDWFYMFSDIASQYDGIRGYLQMQGYTYAYQAPITSTGFVRMNCRRSSRKDKDWHSKFYESKLDLEQYNLLRQCFMGGVCISSFAYSGKTVRSDKLRHEDFTSSYPARQILDYFPVGAPNWYGSVDDIEELEELCNTYCCCFVLTIWNVHIIKGVTAPCIPASKCIHIEHPLKINGKVVYAETITMIVTELDYKWIKRQYNYSDVSIDKMLIFERGKLPKWLREQVFEYFKNKCSLKGVDDLLYGKSKNMLNGIYGMTATAILREIYKMNEHYILEKHEQTDKEKAAALLKYYRSYNNFMEYQAAVWTTAHARDALFTMIEMTGDNEGIRNDLTDTYKNFIYCDTDSVFYIETPENAERMQKYREYCRERAKSAEAYVGDKYLGAPESEPPLRAFRGLHSKCYAMEEQNKAGNYELQVVIAGIPKSAIKWIDGRPVSMTNAEELGSIDKLEDGFTFKHCGGTRCVYYERPISNININGHMTELSSSAVIESIEKAISDTMYTAGANYSPMHIVQQS